MASDAVSASNTIYRKHEPHFTVETNNATELVATAAGNIERLLANRSEALKVSRLAAEAEKFQMEHVWRDGSEVSELISSLMPKKRNRYIPDDFEEDPDFKRLVSYNTTAVHIPTDIYEGSTIILNELNWTEALEDVFRKNKEEDPSLLWQVFGSATGLARYYPASPWTNSSNLPNKIDLYDVRRRPWYIQGAASPKDMLILVDASGSVSGLTLKLIRQSVGKMLETLSDDDFVNVLFFNEGANNASCFQNLVQANVRNKNKLKADVNKITAKGITNYKAGFEMAFKQLAQTNVARANCNKIIMLFTDGGEEKAEEIFKVRIFTFSVGQHNYDKGPIQWMACTNKGYYYEIPSIGATRINTQEYLDVLGRPMVKESRKAKQVQWTNVYLDALELGLVITGTLPVFNKTGMGTKKPALFIQQMSYLVQGVQICSSLFPFFFLQFGPNGYYFAIDPNGYVLLHPNLQPLTLEFADPVTLDFLDAELENDIKVQIRKKMIDAETGSYTIDTLVKSQDERYIDVGKRTYTFAPVKGTDYSTEPNFNLVIHFFFHYSITFASHRMYCKDLKPDKKKNNTEFLMDFNDFIDTKTPNHPLCEDGVLARFVATDGGITRVYPKSAGLSWKEDAETYESSFYKRSLDNDLPTRVDDSILVSKAVHIETNGIALKPAVVGVKLDISAWMASFINTTYRMDNVDCSILDDGGFLVMSNQDDDISQIGRFFGIIDPALMAELLNESLFDIKKTFDYQSTCDPKKESKAAAGLRSVYVPTIADMLNVGWWSFFLMMEDEMSDGKHKQACITEQTQYFFADDRVTFAGKIDCLNCSRMYHAEKLPRTNLVFIIADNRGSCLACTSKPITQEEKPSEGPDPCILSNNPRYRKGPAVCFDNTEHEEDPDCGGASGLSPSLWLMVALQLVLLWVLTGSRHHAIPS
uniref:Calcium channel, voltage-dependent, alpha 2/delta subunit 1a n=1 Tax=Sparus aurata TaxID=8175 RepID=A0A671Z376_SPAAU